MSPAAEEATRKGSRERILAAALELAGREGLEALTTRRVAKEAGVNVGLLHYYFQSKEALVEETLELYVGEILSSAMASGGPEAEEPEARLVALFTGALELASRRPALVFGLVGKIVAAAATPAVRNLDEALRLEGAENQPIRLMARAQARIFGLLGPLLAARLGGDTALVGLRAMQLIASIFHPILFTPFPHLIFGIELREPAERRRYVEAAVRSALRPPDGE